MPKQHLNPSSLFDSTQYGFSQIVTATGDKTVYLSGQVAWDQTQQLVGKGDLLTQARQALRNIAVAMEAAGGSLLDVVSMRIYFVQEHIYTDPSISVVLKEFFPAERLPATTWVSVYGLANKDFLIEIEAIGIIEQL